MLDDDVPMDGLDDELETLRRNYSGLVQQFWLERLGRILDAVSAIAVRESTCGFCGDRLSMRLDNGAIIKMKLLWPTRERFAALISLRWTDGLGWVLKARSTAGEAVTCYGWQASIAGLNTAAQW